MKCVESSTGNLVMGANQTVIISREERFYVSKKIAVRDASNEHTLGYLLDISEHGFAMVTEHKLRFNIPYQFRLIFDCGTEDDHIIQHLDFLASLVWLNALSVGKYKAGFRASPANTKSRLRFKKIIEDHCM